ncbi:MAG: isoprenylcysteine carboxylmethyltransferase family protein [Candidatus Krumholzibacteriia bacterium]
MPALIIVVSLASVAVIFTVTARRLVRLGVEGIGRLPVPAPLFYVGKVALATPVVVLGLAAAGDLLGGDAPPSLRGWSAALLALMGALTTVLAFVHLGPATRSGLPREETTLQTGGIYAVSRNPMYLGAGLLHLGAVLYAPGVVPVGAMVVAALIHHRIVLVEERDLHRRFGAAYDAYRARVRRYV